MSTVYYKATAPTGRDFYSDTVDYAAALTSGEPIDIGAAARRQTAKCCSPTVLHASTVPAETLIGGRWPCRLFEVTGRPVAEDGHKRGFRQLWVIREVSAHLALGPQGEHVAALIERAGQLTAADIERLAVARDAAGAADIEHLAVARVAAWDAARVAAGPAAGAAARVAARDAARDAAWDAAGALVVRDLLRTEHYRTLTHPWASAIGPIHPDDEPETS